MKTIFYDEPMNTPTDIVEGYGYTTHANPSSAPIDSGAGEQGNRNNHKLSPKSIEFDMKKDESVEMFGCMVEQLHKRGIVFTIHQDFNLIWICL